MIKKMKLFVRFKHRKPKVYISFGLYMLLILFIIFESCLPASSSGAHSRFISNIYAFFVNLFKGPQVVEVIKPNNIELTGDSTFLGKDDDDIPMVALGTTSMITYTVSYPGKKSIDTYDKNITINKAILEDDSYVIAQHSYSINKKVGTLTIWLVANKLETSNHKINIKVSNKLEQEYEFKIVDLPAPTSYEASISKTSLKINESATITTKLIDNRTVEENNKRPDRYLRRIFDISKIERSSSNEGVATIDEFGIVHALSMGNSTITYGKETFDVTVSSESIMTPTSFDLVIDPNSNSHPNLLDYDYVYEKKNTEEYYDSNEYSTLIRANFPDLTLPDTSVSWGLDELSKLKAKLGPYKYDENDNPIYVDDEGIPCIRVMGYREEGDITLTCYSNSNPLLTREMNLTIGQALPTSMKLNNVKEGKVSMYMGDQYTLSASFDPVNTHNKRITVSCNDESAIKTNGNGSTSVNITSLKQGNFTIRVTSVANESLTQEFTLSVTAKKAINDDNFSGFNMLVRKFAGHAGLFLISSMFGYLFFYFFYEDKRNKPIYAIIGSLVVGFLLAGLSELLQLFAPGRYAAFADVLTDFLGVSIGVTFSMVIWAIIYMIKRLRENKKKEQD